MPKPAVSLTMTFLRDPRVIAETSDGEAPRVPLENANVSSIRGSRGMDEDFEPIEGEVGRFTGFECHGNPRVRRFFQLLESVKIHVGQITQKRVTQASNIESPRQINSMNAERVRQGK